MLECGCVKISVALLRQPFQPFFSFFQKISYIRSKISIALLRYHFFLEILWVHFNFCVAMLHLTGLFQLFFQNLIGELENQCGFVASEKILYKKETQLFGGRMWMCENQCCIVASAFSAFFQLFLNFFQKIRYMCLKTSVALLRHLFSAFFKNFIGAFQVLCCIVASEKTHV